MPPFRTVSTRQLLRSERLELLVRPLWPMLSCLLLLLPEPVLHSTFAASPLVPSLGLCAVLYWSCAPGLHLPLWFVFAFGLLADAFSAAPLGLHALLFLCAAFVLRLLVRHLRIAHFGTLWLVVSVLVFALAFLAAPLALLAGAKGYGLAVLLLQAAATASVYPLVAWGLELTVVQES